MPCPAPSHAAPRTLQNPVPTYLVEATGLRQSNVSGHLTCLKDCGPVVSRRNGRFVHYRLADPQMNAVLSAADVVLMRHADRIAACIYYRVAGRDR